MPTDTPTEPKPCPFCGGEAYVTNNTSGCWVVCDGDDCDCEYPIGETNNAAKAIAAWNTRTPDADLERLVAKCVAAGRAFAVAANTPRTNISIAETEDAAYRCKDACVAAAANAKGET